MVSIGKTVLPGLVSPRCLSWPEWSFLSFISYFITSQGSFRISVFSLRCFITFISCSGVFRLVILGGVCRVELVFRFTYSKLALRAGKFNQKIPFLYELFYIWLTVLIISPLVPSCSILVPYPVWPRDGFVWATLFWLVSRRLELSRFVLARFVISIPRWHVEDIPAWRPYN